MRYQRGMTLWTGLIGAMLLVSALTVGLKVTPHYLDYSSVSSILDSVTEQEAKGRKSELRKLLERRFTVNSLHDLSVDDVIEIDRTRDGTTVAVSYEVREHLVGNVSVVLSFEKARSF